MFLRQRDIAVGVQAMKQMFWGRDMVAMVTIYVVIGVKQFYLLNLITWH